MRWGVVLGALALTALAGGGVAQLRVSTDLASFAPAGDPSPRTLDDQARAFGGDPIVVLVESERPGELYAPDTFRKLMGLEGALAQIPDVAVVLGPGTALNQVAGQAQGVLARISGRRDAIRITAEQDARARGASPAEAADAASRDFDLRYGSLIVQGLPTGLPTLRNPRFIQNVLFEPDGTTRRQWRYLAPSGTTAAIQVRQREGLDQEGLERLVANVRAAVGSSQLPVRRTTVTGAPVLTASVAQQVKTEIPLLGAAALIAVLGCCFLLARKWRGRRRWYLAPSVAVATTLALLGTAGWLRLELSLGAIAFLPVLFGVASFYPLYLTSRARRRTVVVAAVASAASFAALAISPLPFVRELGLALALGVLLAVGLSVLVCRNSQEMDDEEPARPAPPPVAQRWRAMVLVALLAGACAGAVSLPNLPVEADPGRLAAGLAPLAEAEHAEQVLGSSGEAAVVLEGPDVLTAEALRWSREASTAVLACCGDRLTEAASVPDLLRFLGPDPTSAEITSAMRLVPPYLSGAVVSADARRSAAFFGLRLQDLGEQGALLDTVRGVLPSPPPGYRSELAGLPVLVAASYDSVSTGRYLGNGAGIVAAGLVLALGLRRRSDAARAVLAALLATGWGLLLVQLSGQGLTPFTVALGSLTAAVGCEFTVLLCQGHGKRSVRRAVGLAVASAVAAFVVLDLSELAVMRQFGLFLAASVLLSYLAARLVIWCLPMSREPVSAATSTRHDDQLTTRVPASVDREPVPATAELG